MRLNGITNINDRFVHATTTNHSNASPIREWLTMNFYAGIFVNSANNLTITSKGNQRKPRIACMPERTRLCIVTPEIAIFTDTRS